MVTSRSTDEAMTTNRDLDHQLSRLRQAAVGCDLAGIEQRVWEQIAEREAAGRRPGMKLTWVLASVLVAFAWGMFTGGDVATATAATPSLLVEEMELLPPDFGNLLL